MSRAFLISIIIISFIAFLLINYLSNALAVSFEGSRGVIFVVDKGVTANEIGRDLQKEGLIDNQLTFKLYVFFRRLENKFQAGIYKLYTGMGLGEIVKILTTGGGAEAKITIIEGWDMKDIAKFLERKQIVKEEEFLKEVEDPKIEWLEKYEFLKDKPAKASLEGYLFPDTYRIYLDTSVKDIINKVLANFDKKLNGELREEIKRQGKSIFEIIIMASLIEKEVPKDEDRKIVAGIFYKRLKSGQPLESCATINYILGESKKRLSLEDTRIKSPYNTYLNLGLPPGPICNPSLSAIKAAIYPQKTDNWYFLSPDDGSIIYSKTLEEHNRNKAEYLK